jgi:hypothetical protein
MASKAFELSAAGAVGLALGAYTGLLPSLHDAHQAEDHTGIQRGLVFAGAIATGCAIGAYMADHDPKAVLPVIAIGGLLTYAYTRAGAGRQVLVMTDGS